MGEKVPPPPPPVALVSLVLVRSAAKHVALYDISGPFQSPALPVKVCSGPYASVIDKSRSVSASGRM